MDRGKGTMNLGDMWGLGDPRAGEVLPPPQETEKTPGKK